MLYESIDTAAINAEDLPWVPFAPYSDEVLVKYIKCDPVRGETITLLKSPAGVTMPKHHHSGTVIVYTIKGAWKYLEHDWISKEGGVVFETAGTSHTPVALAEYGDEIITLNIVQGDLLYFDENDNLCAIENWKSGVERYLAYCKASGIEAKDITSFSV
ncbi:2,4'-dihydroxyacetophenone dioxygenase family protein [Pseudomonas sp. NPDC077186]|uniref:2,4'-dihydroxyacetophenone dioxygenase family protein n=1 Tax=Pseudomonas sp. NPDC077186 TaxID=3364421 RepID=UPI0037C8D0CD